MLSYGMYFLSGNVAGKYFLRNDWILGENYLTRRKTGLKGFEPLTCGLRVRRYAELSYRPKPVSPNNVVDDAE
jgi:hypothetical protein